MDKEQLEKIILVFKSYKKVGLAYLFGSRATGKVGPLSDYDFAIYLDEKDLKKRFDIRLELMGKVSRVLETDALDLCVINDIESPEFKYNIIKDGKVIFEREPFKILIEPKILNEYFDFHNSLVEYNLTKTR
jgi:predicted nucleotidyltransferase